MFAFQLGGALYTHIMVDGRIQDCLMLFIYLANSCAVQYLFGYYGILHQLVAFVLGYMCGYVVTAIGVADIMQQVLHAINSGSLSKKGQAVQLVNDMKAKILETLALPGCSDESDDSGSDAD